MVENDSVSVRGSLREYRIFYQLGTMEPPHTYRIGPISDDIAHWQILGEIEK